MFKKDKDSTEVEPLLLDDLSDAPVSLCTTTLDWFFNDNFFAQCFKGPNLKAEDCRGNTRNLLDRHITQL